MGFWDFAVLWLIVGFLTVIFVSITDYKKYRMYSTVLDLICYILLFFGGPVYCIVRIVKRLIRRKDKFDHNWKNIHHKN